MNPTTTKIKKENFAIIVLDCKKDELAVTALLFEKPFTTLLIFCFIPSAAVLTAEVALSNALSSGVD